GQDIKKIESGSDRDYYLNATDAVKYGLVDKVIK
ncbi:MAG: ATP-dependent Clp protease proteolytic subunit, partial [Patescibacteria group bacterium]|nr:ATP-dependent Clp protease proteolytic subunit [Patescibacteria group bacterium]